ncbi:MAG: spondin domain-containing protein [Chloroflexi bacterium]|nr:spondin domain-containing protein [Chloroflexota bacterium]
MRLKATLVLALLLVISGGVLADHHEGATFTVTIENISGIGLFDNTGVAAVPVGGESAGPALPGGAYEFVIQAEAGDTLTFATMLAQSNDLFFAPDEAGIALYDDEGNAISGDVSDQVDLWDAGTEVNQPIGEGDEQAPRQAGPNTGADEMGVVQLVSDLDDGLAYPAASDIIAVSLDAGEMGQFTVRVENVSGDSMFATPITPVFWLVESRDMMMDDAMMMSGALFTSGHPDFGYGLESLAEDGNPATLAEVMGGGDFATPLAPVVWALHEDMMGVGVFFTTGEADRGEGLEALAEDGNPAALADSLGDIRHGVQAVPDGADGPGPAFPGGSYSFGFEASAGDRLSFATMFVQSNDLFFGPDEDGIALFDDMGHPIEGRITRHIDLWDAGTEVNQEPGVGADQAPRQAAANTGADEMGPVQLVADSGDGYSYSSVAALVRVTISVDSME